MSDSSSVYNELRLQHQLCDVVIRVDNLEFPAHKVILCNCSAYFRALFINWSTPDCHVFEIPNMSSAMFKLIIEFAYTGFVHLTEENVQELFIAADRLNIKGILKACSDFIEGHMDAKNCIGICWFTDTFYNPELMDKAQLFMINHFEEIAATSEEFPLLSAQELANIIENDQLNVKERKVFEAILHWIAHAPEERGEYIDLLLSKVRLVWMSPGDIIENVTYNELVRSSKECRPILHRARKAILDTQTNMFSQYTFCNPLTRPRLPAAYLLAVGGWTNGHTTNEIEAYDIRANCWFSVAENDEVPRAYLGTAIFNGSLYCIGGFDGAEYFNTVDKFDLGTNTWQEVAPMHTRRCYVSVTVLDEFIYALGGFDGEDRLETAERYQPSTNQWTLIESMNEKRSDASCTTFHGRVYICGGFSGDECLRTAEYYNPQTDQWTMIASMSSRRSAIGVITYANHIFAIGGFSGTSRLHTVEVYNPCTGTWHNMPSMLMPRSNFGIAVIDNRLFVVGGYQGFTTTSEVECFDVETNEWSAICDMEISRSALSCCLVYKPGL
ncbi:Kelch-like protein 10 [Collichthys lucidus]|uniref:Kelch-like protein 10 n=1 Tax=Collichthys lucidus TaxID=240159 RepID=A0A4U5US21_COLLU|nr:Kelch-like protein 10 [Collichthys lucidus]